VACSSSCPTPGAHETWGACIRSKNLVIADVETHERRKRVNNTLKEYRDARKSGLQPASTSRKDVRAAWAATEKTGTPFRADKD
jgi:hypothetical protein